MCVHIHVYIPCVYRYMRYTKAHTMCMLYVYIRSVYMSPGRDRRCCCDSYQAARTPEGRSAHGGARRRPARRGSGRGVSPGPAAPVAAPQRRPGKGAAPKPGKERPDRGSAAARALARVWPGAVGRFWCIPYGLLRGWSRGAVKCTD